MLELRESHRYHHGTDNPTSVSVGDVVVVHSTDHLHGFWKLGQVQEVLKGKDNKCQGAVVRVAHKGRQAHTIAPSNYCILWSSSLRTKTAITLMSMTHKWVIQWMSYQQLKRSLPLPVNRQEEQHWKLKIEYWRRHLLTDILLTSTVNGGSMLGTEPIIIFIT